MEQTVKVLRLLPEGQAEVMHIRQSACSGDCHKCSGCGAVQETLAFSADNPIGARPGDRVVVTARTSPVLKAAAVLYVLPLALFFLGYPAGRVLGCSGAITGCIAFLLSMAVVVVYDRKVLSKKKTIYTITGFANDPMGKGETNLD